MAAPPPPAQPVATNQAGSGGTNPPLGPTPYQVTNTGITRLPVPILNMPQTVNVIPQAIIQEQNATTIEQALQYIPGITFSAGEGGQQGDGPIIRGFVARGDLFRDGIRDPGWYTRDAFSIDRDRGLQGPVGVRVRTRRDRRRHQLRHQTADRRELPRVRPRR